MIKTPKISAVLQKEHMGEIAISLDGKIIATGENSVTALKNAKRILPQIENEEFLVTRIQHKYLAV
ncbi:MAG: hypothetical protein AAB592_00405 [Patescibacteria group bacterium]